MARRPALKDRLFTAVCTLGALVFLVAGFSRGHPKAALLGAGFCLGYAVLQSVTRRLTPAARLLSSEAEHAERVVQFRATRLAGSVALAVAAVGLVLEMTVGWEPAVWVAGTALVVVASFVAGLWGFSRTQRR